jgi:hypothetical protein
MDGPAREFRSDFVGHLRKVNERYEACADPEQKRELWAHVIRMLIFLADKFEPALTQDGLLAPAYDLCMALYSLDFGVAEPPLQPRHLKHRAPTPRLALFRGYAAAASQLLIGGGTRASVADAIVAKRLGKIGYQKAAISGDRTITAFTIKGWRKEAREGRPASLMRAAFDSWLDKDSSLENLMPLASNSMKSYPEAHGVTDVRGMLAYVVTIEMLLCDFPPATCAQPEK